MKQFPFPLTCLCLLLSINYPLKQYVCSLPVTFAIQPHRARGPTPLCVHFFQFLAYTTYIYLHKNIYPCIQTHTYTNIHAQYTNTCTSSYIHAYTIYTHRYKYIHMQRHPNINIHAHRNTHTCMHKYIHTCAQI